MVSDAAMQAWKTSFVKHFPWPFWTLPPGPGQSKEQHPPSPPDIYPHPPPPLPTPNENMKIRLWPKLALFCNKHRHSFTSVKHKSKCQSKFFRLTIPTIFYVLSIATDINIQVCKPDYLKCYHIFNLLHSM